MGLFYEKLIRPVFFTQDPERMHDLAVLALTALGKSPTLCQIMQACNQQPTSRPIKLFGLEFRNAVGLAAGMDKNAQFWRAAGALGFGHVEVGTVTRNGQPGNPRPRLFRYEKQAALINRMGFNNDGAEAVANRLKATGAHRKRSLPLGINIGKSRSASLDAAADDYLASFNLLADFADYFAVNVSSPNTPELRQLQGHDYLPGLLGVLRSANLSRAKKLGQKPIPLLIKISPDLNYSQIDSIIEDVLGLEFDGVIATNSSVARPGSLADVDEPGGLSGRPIHRHAVQMVNYIHRATSGRLPIIGVGGVDGAAAAGRMIDAGASLVQVYTGLIYRGPFFPRQVARALAPSQEDWV
jgi:dihydroorotate dehydrogenase